MTQASKQKEFIIEAIAHILKHNYFWFKDKYYVQTWGTAMGTRFAPSYTNLFMGHWEEQNILPQLGENRILWRRYIDDIVLVWQGSKIELLKFIGELNKNDRNLEFISTYSPLLRSRNIYKKMIKYISKHF